MSVETLRRAADRGRRDPDPRWHAAADCWSAAADRIENRPAFALTPVGAHATAAALAYLGESLPEPRCTCLLRPHVPQCAVYTDATATPATGEVTVAEVAGEIAREYRTSDLDGRALMDAIARALLIRFDVTRKEAAVRG